MSVTAKIWTDDFIIETKVDIEKWLKQASDEEINNVIESGFGNDYSCDKIAYFMTDSDAEIAKMFRYLEIVTEKKNIGFEVRIDKDEMLTWLKQNKPEIYKKYDEEWG